MSRQHHSKSSLFLMELLINLLLFCFLCGCGLMFYIKSDSLADNTTFLQNAAVITSSVANIYEQSDGSFSSLCKMYPLATTEGNSIYIYFDEFYHPCEKEFAASYIIAEIISSKPDTLQIEFYNPKYLFSYSIRACHFSPSTLKDTKEVAAP